MKQIVLALLGSLVLNPGLLAAQPAYPLKVSPNHRYLMDQHNEPFLLQGDAPWSLIVVPDQEDAEEYLRIRSRQGFNSIIVNLIEHKFAAHPPRNHAGEEPFTTPGDFTTPNEKYFAHADWVIRKAAQYGIQVLLAPIYLGYKGTEEGWYEEALANGPEKCLAYGRYLGKRYKDFDNIIWLMGGDRDPGKALEEVDAVAKGIRGYDHRHLFTAHCAPEHSALDEYAGGGWLNLNTTYTYKLVHDLLLRDYDRKPPTPFILIESTYEGEHNASEVQIRRQAYWAVLSGATGQCMGNRPIWLFGPGWKKALDSPGAEAMTYLGDIFQPRAWYDLVPDQQHQVVTKGLGEFNGLDYLAAARTSDGSTVIAYMPTRRTVTVDMSKISGSQAKVWWVNPRKGNAATAGTFFTSGSREFTPPGDGDWVLVIDDASRNLPPPGKSR